MDPVATRSWIMSIQVNQLLPKSSSRQQRFILLHLSTLLCCAVFFTQEVDDALRRLQQVDDVLHRLDGTITNIIQQRVGVELDVIPGTVEEEAGDRSSSPGMLDGPWSGLSDFYDSDDESCCLTLHCPICREDIEDWLKTYVESQCPICYETRPMHVMTSCGHGICEACRNKLIQ